VAAIIANDRWWSNRDFRDNSRSPAVSVLELLREAGWKCDSRVENDVLCVVFPRHRYGLEAVVGMIAARLLDGGGGY